MAKKEGKYWNDGYTQYRNQTLVHIRIPRNQLDLYKECAAEQGFKSIGNMFKHLGDIHIKNYVKSKGSVAEELNQTDVFVQSTFEYLQHRKISASKFKTCPYSHFYDNILRTVETKTAAHAMLIDEKVVKAINIILCDNECGKKLKCQKMFDFCKAYVVEHCTHNDKLEKKTENKEIEKTR